MFVPYEGSEGYSPVPYLPYIAAAKLAGALDLQFLAMLYFMRISGLLAAAAITAYAIALTPSLKWMFFCTAMLPTALYQRAVISADGAVLSSTLMVIALCLRAIDRPGASTWHRGLWITLCSLTKPPQLAFTLLETMRLSRNEGKAQWLTALPDRHSRSAAVAAVDRRRVSRCRGLADQRRKRIAARRIQLLVEAHVLAPAPPVKFSSAVVTSLDYSWELWRQLIGVFGWLDVPMRDWVYPIISLLLALTFSAA